MLTLFCFATAHARHEWHFVVGWSFKLNQVDDGVEARVSLTRITWNALLLEKHDFQVVFMHVFDALNPYKHAAWTILVIARELLALVILSRPKKNVTHVRFNIFGIVKKPWDSYHFLNTCKKMINRRWGVSAPSKENMSNKPGSPIGFGDLRQNLGYTP